eukprot:m.10467 g.10467  ORF g.10467 m.10467 type:complete len:95 (-) comp8327_c0_seq1:136-420(-)
MCVVPPPITQDGATTIPTPTTLPPTTRTPKTYTNDNKQQQQDEIPTHTFNTHFRHFNNTNNIGITATLPKYANFIFKFSKTASAKFGPPSIYTR